MSVNTVGSFLNIRDSHLRVVSGNVYATAMNIGGINVDVAQGLQSVTNQGNVTSNTLQFSNATTAFVTTGNVSVGRDLTVTGNTLVSSNLTVTGNTLVSSNLTVTGNVLVSDDLTVTGNVAMDTDTLFVNATTSNVGIGTVTPGYTLDVAGDINFSGTFNQNGAPFVSSPWTKTGADLSYTTGNVSVGKDLTVTGFVGNSGTGAILVPSGTTAQQPSGVTGMLRYNTETGYMEAYTATEWVVIATPPSVTSFDTLNVAVAAVNTDTITVSGSGFDAITNIQLRGADGKNYDTTTFTFTNSGSIGFKIGTLATGQAANRPFKVVVTNGAGLSATSTATLNVGAGVTWTSPAAGATLAAFSTALDENNTELAATDDVGGSAVTYSVPATNLPSPLTLNGSTGAITGIIGAAGTTSVTFRATDNASGTFAERTFSIVGVALLYTFSPNPFTFTNAGASGRFPPGTEYITYATRDADYLAAYTGHSDYSSAAWRTDTAFFNIGYEGTTIRGGSTTTGNTTKRPGLQLWTVPSDGTYRINAKGAKGAGGYPGLAGSSGQGQPSGSYDGNVPGRGATLTADFVFTRGTKIIIIVGQTGESPSINYSGNGGGGATWVLKEAYTTANDQVYMVAGGGGGSGSSSYAATMSTVSGSSSIASSQGTLGSYGAVLTVAAGRRGGSGAGWTGGQNVVYGDNIYGGFRPNYAATMSLADDGYNNWRDDATGGQGASASPLRYFFKNDPLARGIEYVALGGGTDRWGQYATYNSDGGFGGGGANGGQASGGGGGASGGDTASSYTVGDAKGGTSYIMPNGTSGQVVLNRTFPGGTHNNDNGSVTITLL